MCNILTQHLGDTTKAFEELLRANDIDYYMGQSFREQLAQSSALAQRVSAKISGRESTAFIYFVIAKVWSLRRDNFINRLKDKSCSPVCQLVQVDSSMKKIDNPAYLTVYIKK